MKTEEHEQESSKYKEVDINGKKIRDLQYAYDTALLTKDELRNLVDAIKA